MFQSRILQKLINTVKKHFLRIAMALMIIHKLLIIPIKKIIVKISTKYKKQRIKLITQINKVTRSNLKIALVI